MLAFLVFGVVVLKEAHHLLAHDHEEHLHCTASGDEVHFHGKEYLPHSCLMCFFNFSPSEKTTANFTIKELIPQPLVAQFFYKNNFSNASIFAVRLRGPPLV